ncbi:MAG: hypothetical protein LBM60_06110 [Clostridium sp.]|jgi:hypothetical protein|nr:hypothetical protein [Clostridium sp.]
MIWDVLMILLDASVWILLVFILRSEKARLSRKGIYLLCGLLCVLLLAIYFLFGGRYSADFSFISWLSFGFQFGIIPIAIIVYPRHLFKNLFLLFAAHVVVLTGTGLGNALEFATRFGRPANFLMRLTIDTAMLTIIYIVTKRKFPGLYSKSENRTWFSLFIITLLLGAMGLLSTGFLSVTTTDLWPFLPARLCLALVMLAIFYIAGLAQRQAEESAEVQTRSQAAEETVRHKEAASARIVENMAETTRLRHDQRQMYAVMHWMNEPGKEAELEAYCLEVLEQIQHAGEAMNMVGEVLNPTGTSDKKGGEIS